MGRVRRRSRWVMDFRLLGFSPASISTDVHTHASSTPVVEPVTIRAAEAVAAGFAIPPPPRAHDRSRPPGLRLDMACIEATLAETAAVAAVLADVFADDQSAHFPPAADTKAAQTIAGLDGAHAALVCALAARRTWRRADFEAVARRLGLLPNGALEQINDAAVAQCGELLCNGDDPIALSARVAKQLVA